MDYDSTTIPAGYDLARGHTPEVLDLWMNTIESCAGRRSIGTVLDLGCGTGRFSEALASHFAADVVGVDPSAKMLERALAKPQSSRVRFAMGRGEEIPLRSRSVDLVFMSMVFHHFNIPARVALECGRVLRDGGLVFLRAGTLEQISSYPYVPFFPGSVPIMERTLVGKNTVRDTFESAGLRTIEVGIVVQQVAATYAAYADRIAVGGDSVLAQLDPLEFEAGVDVLVVDDWGLTPLTEMERRHFLEVMDDRGGSRSTVLTSQFPVDNWHDLIGSPTLADAVMERILSNSYRLALSGETMRPVKKALQPAGKEGA